jgi:hypothetical protein
MAQKALIFILLLIAFNSCSNEKKAGSISKSDEGWVKIQWTDSLHGDYSFHTRWDYPEGVYRNEFGQLSCDGLCPEGTESKKNKYGKIYSDSLAAFYNLVDTTHQFQTIQSEAWCYEWGGTNFIIGAYKGMDCVEFHTLMNSATHCSLNLIITNGLCYPSIQLVSITSAGNKTYNCSGGYVLVDPLLWKKGIFKSEFNFTFTHPENPRQPIYWKGLIITKIETGSGNDW